MKTRRLWLLALGIMMLGGIGVGIGLAMGGNYHDGYGIYLSGAGGLVCWMRIKRMRKYH